MRLILVQLVLLIATYSPTVYGQTTIWSEDFDGNGGTGSNWGILNQDVGVQGITANLWYVSCQENGNSAGVCGSGCGTDNTLHVGSSSIGDFGAAYDASSLCLPGCLFCDFFGFCSDVRTNKRSQSININTVGQTNLTVNFNYIENGQGTNDDCVVEYSADGGTSWIQLANMAKTTVCGSGQGFWTAQSYILPVICEGISNLRIAYHWQNNADGIGTDPSFAVDDITITTPTPLPVELFSFYGKALQYSNQIIWATASEINNDYFQLEKSINGYDWQQIYRVKGVGNSQEENFYQFEDSQIEATNYYRLKQVDFNGYYSFSDVISLTTSSNSQFSIFPQPFSEQLTVVVHTDYRMKRSGVIKDLTGKSVATFNLVEKNTTFNLSSFSKGVYFVLVLENEKIVYRKKIIKQ